MRGVGRGLLHELVDVVVGVGDSLIAGRRADPLAGVHDQGEVRAAGLLQNAQHVVAGGGVVLQAHDDPFFSGVVAGLLKAADLALLLLGVGKGLAAEHPDQGGAEEGGHVGVFAGLGDFLLQFLVSAHEVTARGHVADGQSVFDALHLDAHQILGSARRESAAAAEVDDVGFEDVGPLYVALDALQSGRIVLAEHGRVYSDFHGFFPF